MLLSMKRQFQGTWLQNSELYKGNHWHEMIALVVSTALISDVKIHFQGQSLKSFLPLHLGEEWPGSGESLEQDRHLIQSSRNTPASIILQLLLFHFFWEPSSWVWEHCPGKATLDTGHCRQDWHPLNLDPSHQKVQIAILHPEWRGPRHDILPSIEKSYCHLDCINSEFPGRFSLRVEFQPFYRRCTCTQVDHSFARPNLAKG